jgi:hypothetical protein
MKAPPALIIQEAARLHKCGRGGHGTLSREGFQEASRKYPVVSMVYGGKIKKNPSVT